MSQDDIGIRSRSLASLKRAKQKENRLLNKEETKDSFKPVKRDINIPEVITIRELANRMAEQSSSIIKHLMGMGVTVTINHTIDADTAETLMFAWMNEEALKCTLRTGEAWYWSRSRGELWHKGATSGQIQEVIELRTDCDQDVVLLKVRPRSPGACHVGYNSCFFRSVHMNSDGTVKLSFEENEKIAK